MKNALFTERNLERYEIYWRTFFRCDRIIWFGEGLKQSLYDRGESTLSDHRPVRAIFTAETEVYRVLQKSDVSNDEGLIDTRTTFRRVLE